MATLLIMALQEESQQRFESHGIPVKYCGIGQVKASFWTTRWILEHQPSHVINLGTAGSRNVPVGHVVECTTFVHRPANLIFPSFYKPLKTEPISDFPQAICGSADFVDANDECKVKCDVMDMEAYAIAYTCHQLGVKFTSLKYVSDNSSENMESDWKSKLAEASDVLLQAYLKLKIQN